MNKNLLLALVWPEVEPVLSTSSPTEALLCTGALEEFCLAHREHPCA